MQAADTPQVEQAIHSRRFESSTRLGICSTRYGRFATPLTVNDARRIMECLQEKPRIDTLHIYSYSLHDVAVLDVFRNGLPLCTSVTTVILDRVNLSNEDLDRLRLAFYNTSIMTLDISRNNIQGQRGGEVLRDLLVGNNTLRELYLSHNNHFGPEVAIGFGQGLTHNHGLQVLSLYDCHIGNDFLANLLLLPADDGMINNSLTDLILEQNDIKGQDGGRQLTLLLQCLAALKALVLNGNNLGPLGARALAPGLAAASHLESLGLLGCYIGNEGVGYLIPDGQENTSLTTLDLGRNNIQGADGGENVIALTSRCTNLDNINVYEYGNSLSLDQQHHLDLLLDRKRLCTEALTLGGSPFSVLFHFVVEKAHCHEHGLSAIFVILQNDGDDYFCTALNRAIE